MRRRQLARVPLPARRLRQVLRRHRQGPRAHLAHLAPARSSGAHHSVSESIQLHILQMLHAHAQMLTLQRP